MSEQLRRKNPENTSEGIDVSAETERLQEMLETKANAEKTLSSVEKDAIHQKAEAAALSSEDIKPAPEREQPPQTHQSTQKELKQAAFGRSMQRVQSKLPSYERAFSKVAHQPVVDAVSTGLAKTVARPSGILGGGIAALVGSSLLLYLSKQYGFVYNYSMFIVLIFAGYLIGLGLEFLRRTLRTRHSK